MNVLRALLFCEGAVDVRVFVAGIARALIARKKSSTNPGDSAIIAAENKMNARLEPILLWLVLLLPAFSASAQNYSIDWYKVSGGGGTSSNGQYAVSGTIGQHDAGGPMTGGTYSLTGGFWAIYAVQMPGSPYLFITQSGTNAILSWSASAAGFLLESKTSLAAPGGWSTVSPGPTSMNGTNYVTNGIVPGNSYYRLRHP